jgi:hypothetical protein
MGFFKRRRERESAIPPSTLETVSPEPAPAEPEPTTSTSEPPPREPEQTSASEPPAPAPEQTAASEPRASAPPPAPGGRSIAEEVTAAVGGDLATHVERLRSLMAQHSVDLQRLPEKEQKSVVRDLNRVGVPAKVDEPLEVTDIQQVQAIESVLRKHGLIPENADVAG